ncbi:Hemin-binding periplasmic protein hmuT precursor [Serratia fonticola]|uniref:Hemin-binding periplasmic protein hmuT n=1 Tax=Serratia fonticola TaxID=47917 RepID=A0A4U9WEF2_SERFO|nr:Hemin-binding periplasmic protein hmuT precursor [Serratia fonticola]
MSRLLHLNRRKSPHDSFFAPSPGAVHRPGVSISRRGGREIVSIGGDVTEIAFALGAGDEVVARDSTSLHPAAVQKLPDVGYMRQLNAEGSWR